MKVLHQISKRITALTGSLAKAMKSFGAGVHDLFSKAAYGVSDAITAAEFRIVAALRRVAAFALSVGSIADGKIKRFLDGV